jgi:prepilin-type N-terminal cleavage/methylation domain-containing protein/prepilin-type processing-associated H-X9-DG protein
MAHRRRRNRGFTLIELLVVVSIIALLIAILVPSLAGARRQARQSVCLGQLQQLGVALEVYANQFNGFVPVVYGGSVKWGAEHGALYQLLVASGIQPKSEEIPKVLVCTDSQPRDSISYALNAVFFGYKHRFGEENGSDTPSLQVTEPRNPSKVVALYDVHLDSLAKVWHASLGSDEADISDQFTGTGMLGTAVPNPAGFMWQLSVDERPIRAKAPHDEYYNVLFVDGHGASYSRWTSTEMTRLTGAEPNDSRLY